MRTESYLDVNLSTADASTPDGIVHVGVFFDIGGDAETEVMILNDGDESLSLNYNNIEFFEDMYVGDMVSFRSYLTGAGNSSRDVVIEGYKLATPASRAGKVNAKPGDMVWFDEPRLIARETCRAIIRKEQQRGRQPSGIVEDPWFELEF